MDKKLQQMQAGFHTAFIDYSQNSEPGYRPQFISNDYKEGRKVIASIEQELKRCDEFFISVAFITEGGVVPLLQTLKELEERNVRGRILTTNYLNFSEPEALMRLSRFSNIDVRMYFVEEGGAGFHTKGYMFREDEIYKIIVGSSNMTMHALAVNKEWNTKIIATEKGQYVREMRGEFDKLWDKSRPLDDCIQIYKGVYDNHRRARETFQKSPQRQDSLKPNSMQVSFMENLKDLLTKGEKRALLISATGTGKTYASAFALRGMKPERALFIVHREQIAKQAKRSYEAVFGQSKSFGILSSAHKDYEKDLLFSTVQTLSKDEVLTKFERDAFDVIVVDEVHRAGAEMHRKVMEYFTPKLYLGMTASPERTDGFDIFSLFDHNIAYEIRLKQALEEDMLCPFHYFGISELEIDGETFDDETGLKNFSRLVSDVRVEHIIEKIKYYGYSGNRVKGLIFCSTREESKILSEKFNSRGYKTLNLSGEDSQDARERAIDRLVRDDIEDRLDYIFTVDIFNEGVDIPEINQVVMLRPTKSPVVFVQQLGRGLRKSRGKDFVVILDFIGNYKNNFMIPVALSGDRSYNKDTIRRYVSSGTRIIPGSSSIHFDRVARKRIYESIDAAKTNDVRLIREAYKNLKYRLGRVPSLMDFDQYGAIDVTKIFENKSFGTYHTFLKKCDGDNYKTELSQEQVSALEYISKKFAKGKRPHEMELLLCLLKQPQDPAAEFRRRMKENYKIEVSEAEEISVINNLSFDFLMPKDRETLGEPFMELSSGGRWRMSPSFKEMTENEDFSQMVRELAQFAVSRYVNNYSARYKDTNFCLYQKYTYEDICRLLNWEKQMNPLNVGGYFYEKKTKTMPVFISYDRKNASYDHRFVSNKELIAFSKHPRDVNSPDADHIYKRRESEKDNRMYLFVRKNKNDREAKEFYFLGEINAVGRPKPVILEKTKDEAFEITYVLDEPVREDIYEYITGE
ncbi:MAG: DEAD/DEAH box helicase [Firmicutes bacterium]|nr:DEAD/DEAH box helicase [Bacillota bacterium]